MRRLVFCFLYRSTANLAILPLFFFNDTATTEIYTLSLHDALPIYLKFSGRSASRGQKVHKFDFACSDVREIKKDRKSTRLNSSHGYISYAVFCLKKKKITHRIYPSDSQRSRRPTCRSRVPCPSHTC